MYAFLFSDSNLWFSICIGLVFALFTLEILGMLFGLSLLSFLDDISPVEVDTDISINGGFSSLLSWLCIDKLPLMIWLVLLLTSFGLSGYMINYTSLTLFTSTLSNTLSIPIAGLLSLLITARLGEFIARLIPKSESSATRTTDLEGHVAEITLGTAKMHSAAEAKCVDEFNQTHYLMVEPLEEDEEFHQGEHVILVKKGTRSWQATRYQ